MAQGIACIEATGSHTVEIETRFADPNFIYRLVTPLGFVLFLFLIGLTGWEVYTRLMRGAALAAKEKDYVTSVRALGVSSLRTYTRHIFAQYLRCYPSRIYRKLIVDHPVGNCLEFPGSWRSNATYKSRTNNERGPRPTFDLLVIDPDTRCNDLFHGRFHQYCRKLLA